MTTDAVTARRVTTTHPLRGTAGLLAMELRVWFPWRWLVLSAVGAGVFALIYIPWTLTETNQLGSLLYFFEFAVAVSGRLLGVNPFDQPGVEAYKTNLFRRLGKPGFTD